MRFGQDPFTQSPFTRQSRRSTPLIIITSAGVLGFSPPKTGYAPQSASTLTPIGTGYSVTSLTWSPADSTFQLLGNYVAIVVLTASTGYAFPSTGIAHPYATGGAVSSGVTNRSGSGNTLTFTVVFPMHMAISVSVEQTPTSKMMSATDRKSVV
jgi:hypothetical protein